MLYDDNEITIDGPTSLSFSSEDVPKRFEAYGWHTLTVEDGNDLEAIEAAIRAGHRRGGAADADQLKTVIGYGSPRAGTRSGAQRPDARRPGSRDEGGARLGSGRVLPRARTRSTRIGASQRATRRRGAGRVAASGSTPGRRRNAELAADWHDAWAGRPRAGFAEALPEFEADRRRSRRASRRREVMQAFGPYVPTMVGGAADLVHSTFTQFDGEYGLHAGALAGRNVAWGVREHGMGAALNGLALHGGILKPFGSTFFVFTDYMRPPIRLSALMKLERASGSSATTRSRSARTARPISRSSISRRCGRSRSLTVIRPADANEAVRGVGRDPRGARGPGLPRALAPERADARPRRRTRRPRACAAAPTSLADVDSPDVVLVATGAEVATALGARDLLAEKGIAGPRRLDAELGALRGAGRRVPRGGSAARRAEDLGRGGDDLRLVDAGSTQSVSIDTFGASGKGGKVLEHFGISPSGGRRLRVEEIALARLA